MRRWSRAAFTLPEALVAGAIFIGVIGSLYFAMSGARKEEEMASLYLNLMESASIAIEQLQTDLRQVVALSHKDLKPFSILVSGNYHAVRIRHEALRATNGDGPVPFLFVEYRLQPLDDQPRRFHLVRLEKTSDGSPLPAGHTAQTVFRSFVLKGATFFSVSDDATKTHMLHVGLKLVSGGGQKGKHGAFSEKRMLLTNVLQLQQPEAPADFAEPLSTDQDEDPLFDALSRATAAADPLPAFSEDDDAATALDDEE